MTPKYLFLAFKVGQYKSNSWSNCKTNDKLIHPVVIAAKLHKMVAALMHMGTYADQNQIIHTYTYMYYDICLHT